MTLTVEKIRRARDVLRDADPLPPMAPIASFAQLLELTANAETTHGLAIETTQYLVPGLLVREIRIPAGALIAGEVHRWEHVNSWCGDITVIDETETVTRFRGFHTAIGQPGARRIGFAHANTVWTTASAIPRYLTDPDEIAAYVVENPRGLQSSRRPMLPMQQGVDVLLAPSPLP